MPKAISRELGDDIGQVFAKYQGMSMGKVVDGKLTAIEGRFWLPEDPQRRLGQWDIEVSVPASYPFGFPRLRETSGFIPMSLERHMMSEREACTEHTYYRNLRARQGLSLTQFMEEFVVRYFKWQVLFESGYAGKLQGWGHGHDGDREFFYEFLNSTDVQFITRALDIASGGKHKLGLNDPCFCGSGKRLKRCHKELITKLRFAVPLNELPGLSTKLFLRA